MWPFGSHRGLEKPKHSFAKLPTKLEKKFHYPKYTATNLTNLTSWAPSRPPVWSHIDGIETTKTVIRTGAPGCHLPFVAQGQSDVVKRKRIAAIPIVIVVRGEQLVCHADVECLFGFIFIDG